MNGYVREKFLFRAGALVWYWPSGCTGIRNQITGWRTLVPYITIYVASS